MRHFTDEQHRAIGTAFGVAIGALLDIGMTPAQIISVFRPEVAAFVIKTLKDEGKA